MYSCFRENDYPIQLKSGGVVQFKQLLTNYCTANKIINEKLSAYNLENNGQAESGVKRMDTFLRNTGKAKRSVVLVSDQWRWNAPKNGLLVPPLEQAKWIKEFPSIRG